MALLTATEAFIRGQKRHLTRSGKRCRGIDFGQSPKGSSRALARRRLNWLLEEGQLENRQLLATLIDLTFANTQTVGGAIFSTDVTTVGAGTGLIDHIDKINTNNPHEQRYNTDFNQVVLDNAAKGGSNFVHAVRITDLPVEVRGGVGYYRFELDINEPNTANGKYLSLDAVQVWQAGVGNLGNYAPGATPDQGTGAFPAATGATLRYNLDTGGDKYVGLNGNLQSGSGNTVDMSLLVPVSL